MDKQDPQNAAANTPATPPQDRTQSSDVKPENNQTPPTPTQNNHKKLILLFIGLFLILLVLVGIFGYIAYIQNRTENSSTSTQQRTESKVAVSPSPTSQNHDSTYVACPKEGALPKEDYLETYTVKSGDSILSISTNILGDSSRVQELIKLNEDKYPDLSVTNSFLEQGWRLSLPPKDKATNGLITIRGGRVSKSNVGWGVNWLNAGAGPFELSSLPKTIKDEDCAIVIYQGKDISASNSDIEVIEVTKQE